MEGDFVSEYAYCILGISIHSLRVEGDLFAAFKVFADITFQSTPSVWRETLHQQEFLITYYQFQSTPSVWRETVNGVGNGDYTHGISIHSLRVEGDCILQ